MKLKYFRHLAVILIIVAMNLCTVAMDNCKEVSNTNNLLTLANNSIPKTISIKNYGAIGDGVTNDYDAILKAITSGAQDIYIPTGKYECGGNTIVLPKSVKIHGDGIDKSILSNLLIENTNGLHLEALTIDGGAACTLPTPGGRTFNTRCGVVSKPENSKCYVSYSKTKFTNMEYGSFICGKSYLSYDKAINCNFENIGKVAIYHSINIGQSTYQGNSFSNIGNTNITDGPIAAIWIGDVTNSTNTESDYVNISNNQFEDLYTGTDPSFQPHRVNANFICVRANKADIKKNKLYRIHGYGDDREAIYTKVKTLLVENNYIQDGGVGEGYICCKGQNGVDTYCIIRKNTIVGSYGSGIHLFGAGEIRGNTITLTNSKDAIVCHNKDMESDKDVVIDGNTISITPDYLRINGSIAEAYTCSCAIYFEAKRHKIELRNNTIKIDNSMGLVKSVIEGIALVKDVSIINNSITTTSIGATGVYLHAGDTYADLNSSIIVDVSNNIVYTDMIAIKIAFINKSDILSNRTFHISNNTVYDEFEGSLVSVVSGDNNNDKLEYFTKQDNAGMDRVKTNVSSVTNSH